MAEITAQIKPDYEAEAWTVGVRIGGLLVHDIEGLCKDEADDLAERINKYNEVKADRDVAVGKIEMTIQTLEAVHKDTGRGAVALIADLNAFLAKHKEAGTLDDPTKEMK
jgi:hypothetical protein